MAAGEDAMGWEPERMLAGSGGETIAPLLVPATPERLMALRDALAGSKTAVAGPFVLNSRGRKMFSGSPGGPSGHAQTATESLPGAAQPSESPTELPRARK